MSRGWATPGRMLAPRESFRLAAWAGLAGLLCVGWCLPQAHSQEPAVAQDVSDTGNQAGLLDFALMQMGISREPNAGPNDVRDILVAGDQLLIATGHGIQRYDFSQDVPRGMALVTVRDGLPSDDCFLLKEDARGGVWACCEGGVGYLPAGAERWQAFTAQNGLPPGRITSITISPDGNRVWVTAGGGLATAPVAQPEWQVFPASHLIDVFLDPTADVAWCRKAVPSGCMCGVNVLTTQFDLQTGEWFDIPRSCNCPHVAFAPICVNQPQGFLWLAGGGQAPLAFDLAHRTTRTWPEGPNGDDSAREFDFVGGMVYPRGSDGDVWFASVSGIWRYRAKTDTWENAPYSRWNLTGVPSLAASTDGKTLYWMCDRTVAAYDVAAGIWTQLWHSNDELDSCAEPSLALSPDDNYLWMIGDEKSLIADLNTKAVIELSDADWVGLSKAKFVRFDPVRHRAIIGTPKGTVIADYDGKLRFALARPAPPVWEPVSKFTFAPDGSEVWCLQEGTLGSGTSAAVLQPNRARWEVVPDVIEYANSPCVASSSDGRTLWRVCNQDGERSVCQRVPGSVEWKPFWLDTEDHPTWVKAVWPSPNGTDLWIKDGYRGLCRVRLPDPEKAASPEEAGGRQADLSFAIGSEAVHACLFALDGAVVLCSVNEGENHWVTRIDLATGVATNHSTDDVSIDAILLAPDGRTVWCVSSDLAIRAMDVETGKWVCREAAREGGLLGGCLWEAVFSPDGAFLWLRGSNGLACYCVQDHSWKDFVGEAWRCRNGEPAFCLTPNGKHIACAHGLGLALIEVDGRDFRVVSPGGNAPGSLVTRVVPVPQPGGLVCSVTRSEGAELYYVDPESAEPRKLKELKGPVTAMAVDPQGRLWVAVATRLLCLDPQTGTDCPVSALLEVGEPAVTVLGKNAPSAADVIVAPPSARHQRVASCPEPLPSRPVPVVLATVGSSKAGFYAMNAPAVAESDAGKRYVVWWACNALPSPSPNDFPMVSGRFLPFGGADSGGVGMSVYDGRHWLPVQPLASCVNNSSRGIAWCDHEDLHLLMAPAVRTGYYHFTCRSGAPAWTRGEYFCCDTASYCERDGTVHLAGFDSVKRRVGYRRFDGKTWSDEVGFDMHDDDENWLQLAVAAASDGTAYIVWKDGGTFVACASIRNGKARFARHAFADRPIAGRQIVESAFAITTTIEDILVIVYCADLYEEHPDSRDAHVRTWDGTAWSAPEVIPFGTERFDWPIFLLHGREHLLSWVSESSSRVFSVLRADGTWSYPLPVCAVEGNMPGCIGQTAFHVDSQGHVHAFWRERDHACTVEVTSLGAN